MNDGRGAGSPRDVWAQQPSEPGCGSLRQQRVAVCALGNSKQKIAADPFVTAKSTGFQEYLSRIEE